MMEIIEYRVTKIRPLVNDAIMLTLQECNGAMVHYEAGQFLTFIFSVQGKELRRSYSISSTPGIDKDLAVVIKRVENGTISRYLIHHLKEGDLLRSLPPAGRFTIYTDTITTRTLFFLAAGSGISPVFSLIKKVLFEEPLSRIILIYQNRNESTIIFYTELDLLQKQFPDRLSIVHLLSSPIGKSFQPQRLNNSLLERLIKSYFQPGSQHDFYICGPVAFMRMVQFVLKLMGVADDHIRKENFVTDTALPQYFNMDDAPRNIKILWKEQVIEFPVSYPDTILTGALKNNVPLPYSCRAGRCASCTLFCVSGKVTMSYNEVLTARDLREGLVLTCVGYAETDLVLQVGV